MDSTEKTILRYELKAWVNINNATYLSVLCDKSQGAFLSAYFVKKLKTYDMR